MIRAGQCEEDGKHETNRAGLRNRCGVWRSERAAATPIARHARGAQWRVPCPGRVRTVARTAQRVSTLSRRLGEQGRFRPETTCVTDTFVSAKTGAFVAAHTMREGLTITGRCCCHWQQSMPRRCGRLWRDGRRCAGRRQFRQLFANEYWPFGNFPGTVYRFRSSGPKRRVKRATPSPDFARLS